MRDKLEVYYNKFNEDKRLGRRHGNVEFEVTYSYILKILETLKQENEISSNSNVTILDIGAGTGRYSIPLHALGYNVLAIEPFKCNLNKLKNNDPNVKTMLGNAKNLKKIEDNTSNLTLLFGPLYHLGTKTEKLQALTEAVRVTKPNGIIMVAYISNDYSVVTHGFKSHKIEECKKNNQIDDNFITQYTENDLYSFMRISDIFELTSKLSNVTRIKIVGTDGPSEYMRREINEMSQSEYELFIDYVKQIAERQDLIGASAHIMDILRVEK